MSNSTTLVLVHGGFLGPWLWADVQELLTERGINSVVPNLPGMDDAFADFYADVSAVKISVAEAGACVLCGHSYAGMVVTEVANDPSLDIRRLVYLAAAVPDAGQSLEGLATSLAIGSEDDDGEEVVVGADGRVQLTTIAARESLFHDCSPERADAAIALLRPLNPMTASQSVTDAGWRKVPATLVEAADDRLPRLVSRTFDAADHDTIQLPTGHCPQWSRPELVADLLAEAALQQG
jgi:pimeloyl-ACP methyl ester carboxylesterase